MPAPEGPHASITVEKALYLSMQRSTATTCGSSLPNKLVEHSLALLSPYLARLPKSSPEMDRMILHAIFGPEYQMAYQELAGMF